MSQHGPARTTLRPNACRTTNQFGTPHPTDRCTPGQSTRQTNPVQHARQTDSVQGERHVSPKHSTPLPPTDRHTSDQPARQAMPFRYTRLAIPVPARTTCRTASLHPTTLDEPSRTTSHPTPELTTTRPETGLPRRHSSPKPPIRLLSPGHCVLPHFYPNDIPVLAHPHDMPTRSAHPIRLPRFSPDRPTRLTSSDRYQPYDYPVPDSAPHTDYPLQCGPNDIPTLFCPVDKPSQFSPTTHHHT